MNFDDIKKNLIERENSLSIHATKSTSSIRLKEETSDLRPAFFRDVDRILHSISYTRYMDKTQVFSFKDNDHISKRIVHVQLVSKVARTIGRCLNLNEDLIEAIALGHDIGHTPIGHVGEAILNEISQRELNEYFMHNVQSVRTYLDIDNFGKGNNLSVQVLDGILCHNGEILENIYEPNFTKTKEMFLEEYKNCYTNLEVARKLRPMTLEGCIVRISDIIAYIGRDIEDAIRLGELERSDIPSHITDVLGDNNKSIVNTIIMDIVKNSYNKPYIKMSKEVYDAVFELKSFNRKNIYAKANSKEEVNYYKDAFNKLFSKYLEDLEYNRKDSEIYTLYINNMSKDYVEKTVKQRIVLDFISGMTDDFFIKSYNNIK
ncbi:MAG: HD domain-containing protein [Bacilli bacterium]|nr:HD domain-containing protein [Bacilli bacterium]